MEFHEKLQELRKQKGLTQEELAQSLYVSRTAISKWESGRGYPSIDSLKAIARFFSVTIDQLLSGEEALSIAEEDHKQKEGHLCDLVFGMLDVSAAAFLFFPFFGQTAGNAVQSVSLLALEQITPWLKGIYLSAVMGMILLGILILALQNSTNTVWMKNKYRASILLNWLGILIFAVSQQPYATIFLLIFLTIKVLVRSKKR